MAKMTKKDQELCNKCLTSGAVSGYPGVCKTDCKGGKANEEKINDPWGEN